MTGQLAAAYKSNSQRARVVTEAWGEDNLYCPNCSSPKLSRLSHNTRASDLRDMIRANLVAERVAIETYRQMIHLVGDKDPTTRRLLEEVLNDEEEHAEDLKDMLDE